MFPILVVTERPLNVTEIIMRSRYYNPIADDLISPRNPRIQQRLNQQLSSNDRRRTRSHSLPALSMDQEIEDEHLAFSSLQAEMNLLSDSGLTLVDGARLIFDHEAEDPSETRQRQMSERRALGLPPIGKNLRPNTYKLVPRLLSQPITDNL